jgi:hypothetical protein
MKPWCGKEHHAKWDSLKDSREPIKVTHAWIVIWLSASPFRYDCYCMRGIVNSMRLALLVPALQVDDCERKLSRLVSIGNVLVCRKTFRNLLPFNSGSDTSAKRNMVLVGVARLANLLECRVC